VNQPELDLVGIETVTKIHHAYFLGLQLMVSTRRGSDVVGDWMFRLFRRQHEDKFLSSFTKLGLDKLPHAVACAQYHVLSNGVGGVPVEYMFENDQKAWVRFRYPRWMYAGPTICGVTEDASLGFLKGWYAQNGVSLGNPNLGFVCISQDMTGEFGLCGYFKEYDHALEPDERLVFVKNQHPPKFEVAAQPIPPAGQWGSVRLAKANRNYALEYLRNGLVTLSSVIGRQAAIELGIKAAHLIGLQYYPETAQVLGVPDRGLDSGGDYLCRLFAALGDDVDLQKHSHPQRLEIAHSNLRVTKGLPADEAEIILPCWQALWRGAMQSRRELLALAVVPNENQHLWTLAYDSPSRSNTFPGP